MNQTIKNILGVSGAIFAIMIAVSVILFVNIYARSIEPSSFRSFSVSAEGEAIGIPDVAEFTVQVITEGGTDIGALQTENTNKTNAIMAFIKESGVADKDIQTTGYNISPRYERCLAYRNGVCPPPRIVGYTVNAFITVRARDFDTVGDILTGVVEKGANTVSGLTFKIDNHDAILRQARDEAIAEAKIKAEELANVAGFRVGRLLSVHEGHVTPFMGMKESRAIMSDMAMAPMPAVTIEPGSQELTAMVTLTYEIR